MHLLDMIAKYWPALLILGAITTVVNQTVQKLASIIDKPWAARIANICNTVSVDFVKLLAEIGGALNIGPRKPDDKAKPPAVAGIVFLVTLVALFSCAALKSANDARVWLCDNIGAEHKAEIEAQAKKTGVSADEIWKIWKASCLIRMHQAETGAVGAIGETKP